MAAQPPFAKLGLMQASNQTSNQSLAALALPPPWMMPPPELFKQQMAAFQKVVKEAKNSKEKFQEKTDGELVNDILKDSDSED